MLPFFRKIRFRLAKDNQFLTYSRYAIGEIVLVVVGILIALQINNWNESRKQSASEKEFIASVKNDLKQDKAFIQLVEKLMEPRIEAYAALNKGLKNLYDSDRETLDSIFQVYFNSQRTFYSLSGSYESAVYGNQITAFRNKELIQKIIKLYNSTYSRLIENGQMLDERWSFLSKKYSYERRTGHIQDMTPEQLSEFHDDVYHHYIQMEWYRTQLKLAKKEIDKIISEE